MQAGCDTGDSPDKLNDIPGYAPRDQDVAATATACWWCLHYSESFNTWPGPELSAGKCWVDDSPQSVDGRGHCPRFRGSSVAYDEALEDRL